MDSEGRKIRFIQPFVVVLDRYCVSGFIPSSPPVELGAQYYNELANGTNDDEGYKIRSIQPFAVVLPIANPLPARAYHSSRQR